MCTAEVGTIVVLHCTHVINLKIDDTTSSHITWRGLGYAHNMLCPRCICTVRAAHRVHVSLCGPCVRCVVCEVVLA